MLNKKALAASVSAPPAVFVDDVFSTYLYTGDGTLSRTITNGIDLAGEGGLVWIKNRTTSDSHGLLDTARGVINGISSNTTDAQNDFAGLSSVLSNGFVTSATNAVYYGQNKGGDNICSWTFRKQPKFFDVVTYTGTGSNRTIAHNLGSVTGMIIVKCTSTARNWLVYHRSLGATKGMRLNTTNAEITGTSYWNNTEPTSTEFTVGTNADSNGSGNTYVVYLFAHDAGGFGAAGTDNVISCGSFTAGSSVDVTLGYEPQYILTKRSDGTGGWIITDIMREASNSDWRFLEPNTSSEEFNTGSASIVPTATGFRFLGANLGLTAGENIIYMAIRRPMKVPTTGTEVFSPVAYSGDGTSGRSLTTLNAIDLSIIKWRASSPFPDTWSWSDRLRGIRQLASSNTDAESSNTDHLSQFGPNQNTVLLGSGGTVNGSGITYIQYAFNRRPGFFDVVCYTGNATAGRTVTHNLGVVPELMIVKQRSTTTVWVAYAAPLGNTEYLMLQSTDGGATAGVWDNTTPTASVFSLGSNSAVNQSGGTFVAYLFATLAGVSKVGSYTGNGSSQTINCGFTAGARFVMIKRTDSTGDWVVLDTAKGIVSGNDPFLQLNLSSAEVTGEDIVDPDSSGFIVNSTTENINASGGTYIYLAIA